MNRLGHYGVALFAWAPIGARLLVDGQRTLAAVVGAGVLGLSMLPDCDRRVPLVSHRGPTHSVVFAVLVASVLAGTGQILAGGVSPGTRVAVAGLAGLVGLVAVGSHLVADWLTPAGVPLAWPLSRRRFALGLARADNVLANVSVFLVGACTAAWTVLAYSR